MARRPRTRGRVATYGRLWPNVAGGVVCFLGALALLGWFTRTELLIQIAPTFVPMQFNTALAFLLSGVGLLALNRDNVKVARWLGVVVGTISGLTLLQYLFGLNLFIDELFMDAYITTKTSHPGRMAPNTALCFFLTALVLTDALRLESWMSTSLVKEALGFIILALAFVPFVGYLQGIETAYGWGNLTRMAPHTAVGFMILATGMIIHTWRVRAPLEIAVPLWIPVLISLAVLLIDLYTPLGVAVGVAYVPLVFCGIWFTRPYAPFVLATFSSALIILGFFASAESNTVMSTVFLNRAMSFLAIWVTAVIVFIYKRAQERLQSTETTLAGLIDASYDGYWDWHIQDDYEYMSPRFWEILGYDPSEKEHHPSEWRDLIFKEDLDAWMAECEKHVETRGAHSLSMPVRYRRKDGSTVTVLCRGNVVEWSDEGEPTRMIGTHADITKLVEAQEALRKSQQRLQLATEAGEIGVWEWNPKTNEVMWDERMHLLFDMPRGGPGALVYEDWRGAVHPEDVEEVERHIAEALAGDASYHPKFRIRTKTHGLRHLEARGDVERDAAGEPVRMIGVCWDTTEQKEAEKKLESLIEELTTSNTELERFAYVASHDLREPLRMITSFAGLIADRYEEKLDDAGRQYIRFTVEAAGRMRELIDDLLEYARLGQEAEQIDVVDCEKLMTHVKENLNESIREVGGVVTYSELPMIRGNRVRLMRLLQNLIGNGIKYQQSGRAPEVDVHAERDGGEWVFSVKDNGIGIPKDYQEQIFQPFTRLHGKREYSGTGIGLAICKKIVEGHGGRIWVESAPAKGSVFKFTIPAQAMRENDGQSSDEQSSDGQSNDGQWHSEAKRATS